MTKLIRGLLIVGIIILSFSIIFGVSAQTDENQVNISNPVWAIVDSMRGNLVQAQRELFSANRADDPTIHFASANALIVSAHQHYVDHLQVDLTQYAPDQQVIIQSAFEAL